MGRVLGFVLPFGSRPLDHRQGLLRQPGQVRVVERLDVRVGIPAFNLIASSEDTQPLREAVTEAGACPAGRDALELARIGQGVPAFGSELSETYNPLEAGLQHMVNYTKGCYIGQEVIARLTTYDKVQKRLVRLVWPSDAEVDAGGKLMVDGRQAGVVTSAIRDPRTGTGLGLGYVRKTCPTQARG